jgi:EmrB/QacA subfamily drug resistance transporter
MTAVDNHIVNVMLPTLQREFDVSLSSVQWTVISYVLVLAVFIPAAGWIGDRFGTKRVFLIALGLFTAASVFCGLAQSLPQLVGARVLQGAGAGMLTPVATAMLFRAYPPAERARMTRLLIIPVLLGPVLSQPLGGLFVDTLSWRWAFIINLPFGLIAMGVCFLGLREHREPGREGLDVMGFVLSGFGLSLLLYGLSEGSGRGWRSPLFWGCALAGAVLLAIFARIELRKANPMLKLTLLHDRIFRATNVVNVFNNAAFSGLLFLAPVFLQEARGESALSSGLTTFCTALGVMIASQTVGRLYPRVGPKRMCMFGPVGLSLMLLCFLAVDTDTSLWIVRGVLFLAGFSNSASTIALQTSMFSTISSSDTGSGASIFSVGRQASTAIAIAVFTICISLAPGDIVDRFHFTFVIAAVISICSGLFAALLIHDSDAASTMHAPRTADEKVQRELDLVTE